MCACACLCVRSRSSVNYKQNRLCIQLCATIDAAKQVVLVFMKTSKFH